MGKVKRSKASKIDIDKISKPIALEDQLTCNFTVKPSGRNKQRSKEIDDDDFVGDKLSRKILAQAREQQQELEESHGITEYRQQKLKTTKLTEFQGEDDEEEEIEDETRCQDYKFTQDIYNEMNIDPEDEKALEMFMSNKEGHRRTLGDIINEKITEKKTEIDTHFSDAGSCRLSQVDPRVQEMYKSIGKILTKYRSGKLPKAFKIIPALNNWEQMLYLTDPEGWSAASVYQATRIFTSSLNSKMAQRFINLVLLPRVQDDIHEFKKLNFHLFMALKKSLFKPAAFFKGFLLPLCESGSCVLREAVIVSSVLQRNAIPMLHSAAAILKIAEMDYNGANSIFLKTLLDKKYALPYRVIDAVVFHFIKFKNDHRTLPVLWHQALMTFTQRYKEDMSSEQKDALLDLLRKHNHPGITPDIRRELAESKCRGEWEADKEQMEEN